MKTFVVESPIEMYFGGAVITAPEDEVPGKDEIVILFDPAFDFAQFSVWEVREDGTVRLSPAIPWPEPTERQR